MSKKRADGDHVHSVVPQQGDPMSRLKEAVCYV